MKSPIATCSPNHRVPPPPLRKVSRKPFRWSLGTMVRAAITVPVAIAGLLTAAAEEGETHRLQTFHSQLLTDTYFSEGIATGDIDGDGHVDIVYGPYWFAGPDFARANEIYPPVPQDRNRYADHFFAWTYDFDGDGHLDVLAVGFPGTPAYVYENPGPQGLGGHWKKHPVFDWVSNESPQFVDLTGDGRPELVCTRDGFFGFATVDWQAPFSTWQFHPISDQIAPPRFGHGLGVGDLNGDGRPDILYAKGWFEHPESEALSSRWRHHEVAFTTAYGGADMLVYDVDGDGLADVITSEAAHDFGLSWYRQVPGGGGKSFERNVIVGERPADNPFGVLFTEPHSLALADIDGDGLADVVTGKTYYSHHQQSPLWDAGAVVYWFRLTRTEQGVEYVPYLADGDAGIGRQVIVADVNADGLPDIAVGGMKGAHVLTQQVRPVDRATWQAAQPQPYEPPADDPVANAEPLRGEKAIMDPDTGRADGATEGETLEASVSAGNARPQAMGNFQADRWSGDAQLFWSGGHPGAELEISLPVRDPKSSADLEVVLTCARDYGIVQLLLDDQPLGPPIDCYHPQVITTGVLRFPDVTFGDRPPTLRVRIVGSHPSARPAYMFGLDYVRVVTTSETGSVGADETRPKADN